MEVTVAGLRSVPVGAVPQVSSIAEQAERELSVAVRGRLSRQDVDRLSYARDMWPLGLLWVRQGRTPTPPDFVAWPGDEREVIALIDVARRLKVPLIPFGAGSGVCGGTWAVQGGVAVDLKRFDAIGEVDVRGRFVDVGAGVMGETLERRLNARGFTLGHFPSSIYTSTVGGWLAARSAGQLSSRYGKIEDMVISVRFVTGTGELVVTPPRPFRGPDLQQLFIGSEGTLGMFTGARLRVHPLATGRSFRGFQLPTLGDGLTAIRQMFHDGLRPAVVRLYDPLDTALVGSGHSSDEVVPPSQRGPLETEVVPALLRVLAPQALGRSGLLNRAGALFKKSRLIVMFEGDAQRSAEEEAAARRICTRLGAADLGPEPGEHWLAHRYDVSFRMSKIIEAGAWADTMEVATTWDRVERVYAAVKQAAAPHALVICHFSHAYVEGCSLYFSFVAAAADEQTSRERYDTLWRVALSAAMSAGANVSHHHGIGLLKARALQDSLGDGRVALQQLKTFFDPAGIMNPGKLGL